MARTADLGVAASATGALPVARVQPGQKQRSRWLRLPPHHLALGFTLLALAGHVAAWGLAAPLGRWPALGALLSAAALAWLMWAWAALRRVAWVAGSAPPQGTTRVSQALVDEGPFRFTRNPRALGIAGAMLGLGLALGAPLMAAAALALITVLHWLHIPHEEAELQRAFGGWYSDYAATVRRWL